MFSSNSLHSALVVSLGAIAAAAAAQAGQTARIVDNLRLASGSNVIRTFESANPGVKTLMGGLDFDAAGTGEAATDWHG